MKVKNLLTVILTLPLMPHLSAQAQVELHGQRYTVVNRNLTAVEEGGRTFVRFSEGPGNGLAWLDGQEFSEGTIEFEARGRDQFQRSFVGVAFRGKDDQTYEAIYLRPFNFNVADTARRAHAVQYIYEPKFPWDVLRKLRYNQFESPIGLAAISKTDWFKVKVEVRNGRIRVYVNGQTTPALDVATLSDQKSGKMGWWVGDNANGDFANLKIGK